MTIRGISSVVAASVLGLGISAASGEVVAQYDFEEFTSNFPPAPGPYQNVASSSLGTASDLSNVGLGALEANEVRDSSGGALDSWALLIGPGNIAANSPPAPDPNSADDYLGFSVTADGPLMFTDFSFDFGVSNSTTTLPHNAHAQLFYSIDGGTTFLPVGDRQDRTAPEESFTGMIGSNIDLTTVPLLIDGQSIEFRLGISNDRGIGTTSGGVYVDNLVLDGVVPEPGTAGLLGVAGLGLLARRRRQS